MKFTLEIAPPRTTAQQKGERILWVSDGKAAKPIIQHYEKATVKHARDVYKDALRPYAPESPIEGPIEIKIIWRYKAKKAEWKVTRPDLDNMEKLLLDAMTEMGFWKDDSQVCMKATAKTWSKDSGIDIEVREIT